MFAGTMIFVAAFFFVLFVVSEANYSDELERARNLERDNRQLDAKNLRIEQENIHLNSRIVTLNNALDRALKAMDEIKDKAHVARMDHLTESYVKNHEPEIAAALRDRDIKDIKRGMAG
jgi:hypothetical protein